MRLRGAVIAVIAKRSNAHPLPLPTITVHAHRTTYTFMGHITAAAYAQFVGTFAPSFNATYTTYNLFELVQPADQGPGLPSSTCFDFQFHGLQYLHSASLCAP